MTLAELQRTFFAHATELETPADPPDEFVVGGRLGADERIGIYRQMYLWRMIDAVRQDYPCVSKLLGDERSYSLFAEYVKANPSRYPSIGEYGRGVPEFLRGLPSESRPDLADLAALERARNEVFFAPRASAASLQDLIAQGEDALPGATLRPGALLLVETAFAVDALWRALNADERVPEPSGASQQIAVWRSNEFTVLHLSLSPTWAKALRLAIDGAPLAEVCDCFSDEPNPEQAALTALASWFAEGFFIGQEAS